MDYINMIMSNKETKGCNTEGETNKKPQKEKTGSITQYLLNLRLKTLREEVKILHNECQIKR